MLDVVSDPQCCGSQTVGQSHRFPQSRTTAETRRELNGNLCKDSCVTNNASAAKARQYAQLASHELRGSLHAISNLVDEVATDFGDALPAQARDVLKRAGERCQQATNVVDDILSDPDNLRQRRWLDSRDLFNEMRRRLPVYAEGRQIELTLPEASVKIWGDPIAVREVFANLVSNAIHHLGRSAGRVSIEQHSDGDMITFAVVDDGPGIPPEFLQDVFSPFTRSTTSQHNGTGIGLYLVKLIVEEHGGHVRAEPVESGGTRIVVTLPIGEETAR